MTNNQQKLQDLKVLEAALEIAYEQMELAVKTPYDYEMMGPNLTTADQLKLFDKQLKCIKEQITNFDKIAADELLHKKRLLDLAAYGADMAHGGIKVFDFDCDCPKYCNCDTANDYKVLSEMHEQLKTEVACLEYPSC